MLQDANAGDGYHRLRAGIPTCGIGAISEDQGGGPAHGKDERI